METPELQQLLFNTIKTNLPPHISMVDEIADVLDVSYDSVYRRIRGEKPLTISELKVLCDKYKISLDQLLQRNTDSVLFYAPDLSKPINLDFREHMRDILNQLKFFNSHEKKKMFYLCKDVPLFHFFHIKELISFKCFCWLKSILNHSDFADQLYSFKDYSDPELFDICRKQIEEYNLLPSMELWNVEAFDSTFRQIVYYRDAGLFATDQDFMIVVDAIDRLITHLQKQAEAGKKFLSGATEVTYRQTIDFYINDLIVGHNDILAEVDGKRIVHINYQGLKYLMTRDPRFTEKSFHYFNNLASRSVLISGTGERERNKFFRVFRDKLNVLKSKNGY